MHVSSITYLLKPLEKLDVTKNKAVLSKIATARGTFWPSNVRISQVCLYRLYLPEGNRVSLRYNGLRQPRVWHGFADAFADSGVPLNQWAGENEEGYEYFESFEQSRESDSEEVSTVALTEPYISQLVGTTVINAWIETNTTKCSHPVPSLLINSTSF